MPSRSSPGFSAPAAHELDLFAVMAALADPVRRGIVLALAREDDIACGGFDLPVAKSSAARHFRVLREAGLIDQWEDGNRKRNRLRRDELDRRFPGLLALVLDQLGRSGR